MQPLAPGAQEEEVQARPVFPFTAIVGQEQMKLALMLNIIDPKIGGVMVMGDRGTGKSTTVRALTDLLPEIRVSLACSAHHAAPTLQVQAWHVSTNYTTFYCCSALSGGGGRPLQQRPRRPGGAERRGPPAAAARRRAAGERFGVPRAREGSKQGCKRCSGRMRCHSAAAVKEWSQQSIAGWRVAESFLKLMVSCITTLTRRQAGGACLQTRTTRINMVDLPLGATEDRVCGTIDIEKALTEGVKAFEPGLLVRPPVCQTACRRVLGLLLLLECRVPSGRAL